MRTACRLGEAIALHHIDIKDDVVTIQRSCTGKRVGTTKNGKNREIVLSPQLIKELRTLKSTTIVFPHNGGYIYGQYVRRIWKKMLKAADVPFRKIHNIRHSVASILIAKGVDPAAVQHLLGHSTATFTMAYYVKYMRKKESVAICLDSATNE